MRRKRCGELAMMFVVVGTFYGFSVYIQSAFKPGCGYIRTGDWVVYETYVDCPDDTEEPTFTLRECAGLCEMEVDTLEKQYDPLGLFKDRLAASSEHTVALLGCIKLCVDAGLETTDDDPLGILD